MLSKVFRLFLGGFFIQVVKQLGHETEHSPPSSADQVTIFLPIVHRGNLTGSHRVSKSRRMSCNVAHMVAMRSVYKEEAVQK